MNNKRSKSYLTNMVRVIWQGANKKKYGSKLNLLLEMLTGQAKPE